MPKTKQPPSPSAGAKFCFKGGSFSGVDPQQVGAELERLEIKPGDCHRTNEVLEAARDPDSPLHNCFNWDDVSAAEHQRLNQARQLLRSIAYVIVRGEKRSTQPVYVHIRDSEGPRYVRSESVASDEDLRSSAIDEALTALNGFRKRFEFLVELRPIFDAIEATAAQTKKKNRKKKK